MPPVPAAGMPTRAAVPLPLSTKLTPGGSAPVADSAGTGRPVVVTLKFANTPTMNVALLALVNTGGALTTTVKLCVALGSVPLLAVSVTGKEPACVAGPESTPAGDSVMPLGSTPVVTA